MSEKVLVLPRATVPGGCDFHGLRPAAEGLLPALQVALRAAGRFMDRDAAEGDPSFKQLIPYVVVRDGERVFLMERTDAGGDPRLHRKSTIGVGGHVNPIDDGPDLLRAGLRREWAEELTAEWEPEFNLVGLLNDDSNPVGSVHLGIVFEVEAFGRQLRVRERHKLTGRFVDPDQVLAAWEQMETWSRLVAAARLGRTPAGA